MVDKYLVEHYTDDMLAYNMCARDHQVVEAASAQDAVRSVSAFAPMFVPEELYELIPGYLWEATDGSVVLLAVRRLPE